MKFHYIAIAHVLFHAHPKHFSFVFNRFLPAVSCTIPQCFFYRFPSFPCFDLGYSPSLTHAQPPLQNNVQPCPWVIPSMHIKSMLVLFFVHFSLLFHVHLSLFYPFPSFSYFDLGYWTHDNYPSLSLPCTTSPAKRCSSMFMCNSIDEHQKHVIFVFHRSLPPLSCTIHLCIFYSFPSFPYFDPGYWPHDKYPCPLLPCTSYPSK